jgi:hypothetical protein
VALKDGRDGRRGRAAGLRQGAPGRVQVPAPVWIVDELPKGADPARSCAARSAPREASMSAADEARRGPRGSRGTDAAAARPAARDAHRSPLRRFLPACPGSGSRPAWPPPGGVDAARDGSRATPRSASARRARGRREGPPVREEAGDRTAAPAHPAELPGRRERRAGSSTTPTSGGVTGSGWASSSTTWSRRRPPATTRCSTRRCSSARSTPAEAAWSPAAGGWFATSRRRRGCRRWWSPTRSRSARTSR